MDIPNLSNKQTVKPVNKLENPLSPPQHKQSNNTNKLKPVYLILVAFLGIFVSFWLSRFFPSQTSQITSSSSTQAPLSADKISSANDIEIGKLYGQVNGDFSDTATGTIEKGSINGIGTHILNRQGGASQRASLTSSTVDLDLFVGKLVEIKGQTNTSDKTSWLLDVGSIKVLE